MHPALNELPVQSAGREDGLDVLDEVVLGGTQPVAGGSLEVDREFAGQLVGCADGFCRERSHGAAPSCGRAVLLALVVDDGRGEGAGDGPEDEPVARG